MEVLFGVVQVQVSNGALDRYKILPGDLSFVGLQHSLIVTRLAGVKDQ